MSGQYRATGLTKRYGGVRALDGVDFALDTGEVLAVLGSNGCGKSTLVRLLTGVEQPDNGTLEIDGNPVHLANPRRAHDAGIAVVHQHGQLFNDLSVERNITIDPVPARAGLFMDRREIRRSTIELMRRIDVDLDPAAPVSALDAAGRKTVEVLRALRADPRFLFLDEPTATLEPRESERLFDVIDALRANGTGVVLITHRLAEVARITDRAVSLRDGKPGTALDRTAYSRDALVQMVTGGIVEEVERPADVNDNPVKLTLSDIDLAAGTPHFDLAVRQGEIVTCVGLLGSGVDTLVRAAAGADRRARVGRTTVGQRSFVARTPADAIRHGIGYIPGSRAEATLPGRSLAENYALPWLATLSSAGFSRRHEMRRRTHRGIDDFSVKCRSVDEPIGALSGGSQQKILVARLLNEQIDVLVVNEPTQGVDVAARAQIHASIVAFAARGGAVLMATSDLEEAKTLSNRLLVLHGSRVVRDFATPELIPDIPTITAALTGLGDTDQPQEDTDDVRNDA